MAERPLVAAIPNYNMAESAGNLIENRLLHEEFSNIYVLDDNSSEDTEAIISERFGEQIKVVRGKKNLGAGGNRNRILKALEEQAAPPETIIVFIDADTQLNPDAALATVARELIEEYPQAGMIGGKVLNADGSWGMFNYGPLFSPRYLLGSILQGRVEQLLKNDDQQKLRKFCARHNNRLKDWPDPLNNPTARVVGWVVETFTVTTYKTFAGVGGYDPNFRYCEAVDLGTRLASKGLECVFDPRLAIRHLQIDNRGGQRYFEILNAIAKLALKR